MEAVERDRELEKRIESFSVLKWFDKPDIVSAVECARRGWWCIEMDTLACRVCQHRQIWCPPMSSSKRGNGYCEIKMFVLYFCKKKQKKRTLYRQQQKKLFSSIFSPGFTNIGRTDYANAFLRLLEESHDALCVWFDNPIPWSSQPAPHASMMEILGRFKTLIVNPNHYPCPRLATLFMARMVCMRNLGHLIEHALSSGWQQPSNLLTQVTQRGIV
jgi:hypothetical protein